MEQNTGTWFSYNRGFVNIEKGNIFLTSTGNWAETHRLKERRKGQQSFRGRRNRFLLSAVGVAGALTMVTAFLTPGVSFFFIIFLLGSLAGFYNYLRKETGNTFRIPAGKIIEIRIFGDELHISFLSADNQPDTEVLRGIDPDAGDLLHEYYGDRMLTEEKLIGKPDW